MSAEIAALTIEVSTSLAEKVYHKGHFLTGRYFEWTVLDWGQEPARGVVFPNHVAEKHLMDFISRASYVHTSPTVRQLTPVRRQFRNVPLSRELSHKPQCGADNCRYGRPNTSAA